MFGKQPEFDRLIHLLTHELKSPLVTILGFSAMLKEECQPTLDLQSATYLNFIIKAAYRIDAQVSALSEWAEVPHNINKVPEIDFNEIVSSACLGLKETIQDRQAQIVIVNLLPKVICDKMLMTKLMAHLLVNAINYTPKDRIPHIEIGCQPTSRMYRFWVKDNGIGIDASLYKRVFELFYRKKTLREVEGSGLGLSLAQRIIVAHKGRIYVRANPDNGSCFYFCLPINTDYRVNGSVT